MPGKVLVVDDNRGFSKILKESIESAGYQAVVVDNGVDALLHFMDGGFDITLMDIVMPKLSGIDALRLIKKIDPAARVVIFTGSPSEKMKREVLGLGAIDFLLKPFSIAEIIEIIKTAL